MTNTSTVGTEPVQLDVGAGDVPVLINTGPVTIYFGGVDVTAATGIPLGSGAGYQFPTGLAEAGWSGVWVVTGAGTGEIRYASVG
jgi:hypothetical protein